MIRKACLCDMDVRLLLDDGEVGCLSAADSFRNQVFLDGEMSKSYSVIPAAIVIGRSNGRYKTWESSGSKRLSPNGGRVSGSVTKASASSPIVRGRCENASHSNTNMT